MHSFENFTLTVDNFGPISHGAIDLRPLTVLSGPSNTGKSWFATLLYTLLSGGTNQNFNPVKQNIIDVDFLNTSEPLKMIENPVNWIKNFKREDKILLNTKERSALEAFINKNNKTLEKAICGSFGFADRESLIRWGVQDKTRIQVKSTVPSKADENLEIKLEFDKNVSVPQVSLPKTIDLNGKSHFFQNVVLEYLTEVKGEDIEFSNIILTSLILNLVNDNFFGSGGAVYIPAGRVGLMDSFRTIVSSSIRGNNDVVKQLDQSALPLTGILVDFLQNLVSISPQSRQDKEPNIPKRIEQKILGGEIEVELNPLGFPYFYFSSSTFDARIPLNVASSVVSQLAPVILFLRYLSDRNNTIIFEEPEVNLHPNMLAKLVDEIVELIKVGHRIVITTHSEFFVTALSNHIIKAENNNGAPVLHPRNVGFWHFRDQGSTKGSIVEEVVWDAETGGYDHKLDDAAVDLLNTWLRERVPNDD